MNMLFLTAVLLCGSVSASIVPKNSLSFPINMKSAAGLTKEQFNSVIAKVETIYAPLVKEITGNKFKISKHWADPSVNASADLQPGLSIVNMYGGLARHPSVTEDSFALVICHEIGHHIGGSPKSSLIEWFTIESQADYFATLKCMRRVFLNDDNAAAIKGMTIPKALKDACKKNLRADDRNICIRSGLAALNLQKLFINGEENEGSFSTPDQTIATITLQDHGATQCRLDTFFQGAICEVPFTEDISQKDEVQGTCHAANGHKSGLRPRCWYKPNK